MDLQLAQPATKVGWDKALLALPDPHLLQTWEWGAFKSRHGWIPTRHLWLDPEGGQPHAAVSLLARRVRLLPLRVIYAPKGPILDPAKSDVLDHLLAWLEGIALQRRAVFVKIDPDVEVRTPAGDRVMNTLRRRGWRESDEEIQYRNTIVIDLKPSLDELLMGMKSKWRYNIRLAKRKGVTVREGGLEDLQLLYRMYRETARRAGFVIRREAYYRDAWGSFIEEGLARPLIAEVERQPVAMVVVYRFAHRATYMYGASLDVHRDKMPNNLLQWEAMRWAKERSCTVYDMWGAPDELDESDPMWGVYRFKKGFGGKLVRHIGAWDYPARPAGYRLYRLMTPPILAAMRWLHWRRNPELD